MFWYSTFPNYTIKKIADSCHSRPEIVLDIEWILIETWKIYISNHVIDTSKPYWIDIPPYKNKFPIAIYSENLNSE